MNIQSLLLIFIYIVLIIIHLIAILAISLSDESRRNKIIIIATSVAQMYITATFIAKAISPDAISFPVLDRLGLEISAVFLFPLFAIAALRPSWTKRNWLLIIFGIFIALPTTLVTLDITGASEAIFQTNLAVSNESIDFIRSTNNLFEASEMLDGLFGRLITLGTPIAATFAIIIIVWVAFSDRKRNPPNAINAGIVLIPFIFGTINVFIESDSFLAPINDFIVLLTWAIGLVLIGIRRSNTTFSFSNISRLFNTWPMFNKLMLAITIVVLPGIIILSISALFFLQSNLISRVGEDLHNMASAQIRLIESSLHKEVALLNALASNQKTISLVAARGLTYQDRPENEIFEQIRLAERNWQLEGNNQFVDGLLSDFRNDYLFEFTALASEHMSIVIVDQYGGLVTATNREETFDQSDKEWWQQVMLTQQPYITTTEQMGSTQVTIEIAVPINTNANPNDVEGVLLSRYDLTPILTNQVDILSEANGGIALFTKTGVWIPAPNEIEPGIDLKSLQNLTINSNWIQADYANVPSIIGWASFETHEGADHDDAIVDWFLVSYYELDAVTNPINAARFNILIVGLGLLVGSIGLTALLTRLITFPLQELTKTAERILAGERELKADVEGTDEIGVLATTFNQVTTDLNEIVNTQEQTIQDRTVALERRALQLETSALVAAEAASIRVLENLLNRITELITERFGFYHTGIFLVDEDRQFAVLKSANSPGGIRMLARGHKLQVGKVGVVGFAAGVGETRLAQDVGADVVYYDNPDMPDTRSELALPLKVRNEIIGVLDVQSTRQNAFAREDIQILETLANQIALAIDNTRLLEGSQRALTELQYLYGQQAAEAWRRRVGDQAVERQYQTVAGLSDFQVESTEFSDNRLVQNIVFRGQSIGFIELKRDADGESWTNEEKLLVAEIIEQTALALENARLVDQIRLRSDQIQLLQEITALSSGLLDEKDLLDRVVVRLNTGLSLLHANAMIIDPENETSEVIAISSTQGAPNIQELIGEQLYLSNNEIALQVIREKRPIAVYDVDQLLAADHLHYQHYVGTSTLVVMPLIARGEVLGLIDLCVTNEEQKFEEDEINLLEQIGAQVASALDNTRLFSQTARRAERERLVAEITNKVRASNDPAVIMQTAVQELRSALGVRHANIQFENGNNSNGKTNNGSQEELTADSEKEEQRSEK